MIETFQIGLLIAVVLVVLSGFKLRTTILPVRWAIRLATLPRVAIFLITGATFLGCIAVAGWLHEPVPRIHDEFSYLLMADTFASGQVANPSPPLPQFFDTFHELVRPVYVSKYFPAQGLFLAAGEKLWGHPALGIWLSSALACAAVFWMLQAWVGDTWAFLGALLMVVHIGIFSYWSQSYWGGMAAALGGALFFGAARRLWNRFDWGNSVWLGLGVVILVNSRPLEGILATIPIAGAFAVQVWRKRRWRGLRIWSQFAIPAGIVLLLGATATCAYNRAITGSAFKAPYMLHEQQYQESPPLIFMHLRPQISYSSFWLWVYYHGQEMRLYTAQRVPSLWAIAVARKLRTWWMFYCGILLTPMIVLPVLLRRSGIRYLQIALLVGFVVLGLGTGRTSVGPHVLLDIMAVVQVWILWVVFSDFWSRLALATCSLVMFEMLLSKWAFPHYFAPAACLVLYLQVEGLRRLWHWKGAEHLETVAMKRSARRRAERQNSGVRATGFPLRTFVLLLPLACAVSLVLRVEGRAANWSEDIHGPDRDALLMHDWSLRREELEKWL